MKLINERGLYMRYCYQNTYGDHYNETYYNKLHEVVIIADDDLYDRVPVDGSVVTIKGASLTGYNDTGDVLDAMILAFSNNQNGDGGYLPCGINQQQQVINTSLLSNPLFGELSNCVGINFPNLWELNEQVSFSTGQNNTGINAGGLNMPSGFYSEGFTVDSGWFNHPGFGGSWGYMQAQSDPTHSDHFVYKFDVMPEALIREGTFVSSAMKPSTTEPSDPSRGRWCRCIVECWTYVSGPLAGKYNFTVTINGFDASISTLQYLESNEVPTGPVYNTKNPSGNDPDQNNQGGNGDGDNNNDNINVPELPDNDLTATGSVRLYAPSAGQLSQFMQYLHSASLPEAVMKMWQNPIQGIISIHYMPYAIDTNGSEEVGFMGLSTGIRLNVGKQWQTLDFGKKYLGTSKHNAYLDRAPYTKVEIYLPGIGIRQLNTDDVMGKYIWVQYNCDNVSGQCVAFILVGTSDINKSVKYTYSGSLAAPFPISQANWGQTYAAAATLAAGALANGISAAGAAAPGAGGAAAGSGGAAAAQAVGGALGKVADIGNSVANLAKPSVTRSGTISGTTSIFTMKKPYLIVERPNVVDYKYFNKMKGYACGITLNLNSIKGYTEVETIHLTGIPATEPELEEIERLLKGGVIL